MSFLTPWFLAAGLGAIALPIWLHLLERENPIRLPFSSLMFFEHRTQRSVRRRQLRYLLLLASRIALLALLALAFARPMFHSQTAAALGGARLRLIALDTSFSMKYGDRWKRAQSEALALAASLGSGERAQVIAFGPSVRVMNAPGSDRGVLQSAIRSLEPTSSRNSYGELGQAIRELAQSAAQTAGQGSALATEVHVFSDFQQSAMPARFADLSLPPNSTLEAHNVASGESRNWCVESVKGEFQLYEQARSRIEVTVAGFGTPVASKRVWLNLDGRQVASKNVAVPESGRATVEFSDFDVPHGHSRGEVHIDSADALPADDVRFVSFDRTDPLQILFVHQQGRTRDLLYYQTALASSGQAMFAVQGATPAEVGAADPNRFAFVVVSDVPRLPAQFEKRLKTYVEAGGAALLALGPATVLDGQIPLLNRHVAEARYTAREQERFEQVSQTDTSHPALRNSKGLAGVKVFRYAPWDAPADRVLARLSDGSPLLAEEALGSGRVLVLTSSLDNIWNDLPINPLFVPFVAESARYLSGAEERLTQTTVDSILELHRRRDPRSTVEVFDPAGRRALTLAEAVASPELRLTSTGFYELRRAGQAELVAVNPDPRESDLRPIESDALTMWKATGKPDSSAPGAGPSAAPGSRTASQDIWRFVLLVAAAAAVIESLLANLHLGLRHEVRSE